MSTDPLDPTLSDGDQIVHSDDIREPVPQYVDRDDLLVLPDVRHHHAITLLALREIYLRDGHPDATLAASLMGTSVRTLTRRLAGSGHSYCGITDRLRSNKAKNLLENTDARVIEVAGAVGFEDPIHFAQAFRRIGGLSPCEFRRAHLDRGL